MDLLLVSGLGIVSEEICPNGPEEARDMWLNYGKKLITSLKGFEEAVIYAVKDEDEENYILIAAFKDSQTLDLFSDWVYDMSEGVGPLAPLMDIFSGDMAGWQSDIEWPEYHYSILTLW